MILPSEHTSTLVLERPRDGRRSAPVVDAGPLGNLDGRTVAPPSGPVPAVAPVTAGRPAGPSPGLALLAAISILQGYTWIGAIPTTHSRLSALLFGRAGALVFAVAATAASVALTRVAPGGRRPLSQTLVLVAAVAVMASGIVLLSAGGTVGKHAFGVADLALASALAGSLIVGHRGQRAQRSQWAGPWGRTPTVPGEAPTIPPCR